MSVKEVMLFVVAFVSGSIPFGVIFSKLFSGEDPRKVGSGNIGATNVVRAAGVKAGILTLIFDIAKGAVPVILARKMLGSENMAALCGVFAILGHCYSPFLGFRGGKGVATGAGVFLAISPLSFFMAFVVFMLVFVFSKIVSLSSISAAISMPVFVYITTKDFSFALITLVVSLLVVFRHKDNIQRLLKGEERKFSLGR